METGQRLPRLETLVRLLGGLGVRAEDILGGIAYEPAVLKSGGFVIDSREQEHD